MASPSPILQALTRYPRLDPQAVLRVAGAEGLSGGIGDNGHAFGPFQENDAGGVLTGRLNGLSPQQKNAWAWSPQGINDALSRINQVAAGQHGPQAVNSIVRGFERPADPNGEVARALGGSQAGGGAPLSAGNAAAPGIPNRSAFVSALLGAISPTGQLSNPGALIQALQTRNAAWGGHEGAGATVGGKAGQGQSGLPPRKFAAVDGVQVDPAIAGQLEQVVKMFGVTPTSGYRDPSHNAAVGGAENSDHLRGDAVDFAGSPSALQALYKWAQTHAPYVEPMAQAKNHVHVSFRR